MNASFESCRYMRKCEIKQNSQEIIKNIKKKLREKNKNLPLLLLELKFEGTNCQYLCYSLSLLNITSKKVNNNSCFFEQCWRDVKMWEYEYIYNFI